MYHVRAMKIHKNLISIKDKTLTDFIRRLIDIGFSLVGLLILFSILPLLGLLIKLDSKGPVFYPVRRVGKDMKIFNMYKFRTMLETPIEVGESVSPQFDPRVTPFGRFLRRTKMNELPQFLNVLKGDMAFVGPRPEAPDLAELYPEDAKRVFSVKPGLVGPATILGRNEEEFFPAGVDVKKYYIEKILPGKVKLDLEYIENPALFKDFLYIFVGIKETVVGAVRKRHLKDNQSQILLLLADFLLIVFSYMLIFVIYTGKFAGGGSLQWIFMMPPVVIAVRLICNTYFGMYSSLIRYISYHEVLGVFKGVTCGSVFLVLIDRVFDLNYYPIKAVVIEWVCISVLLSGLRLGLRFYRDIKLGKTVSTEKHRILIYGATDEGYRAYCALSFFTNNKCSSFEVIGFIDDEPNKYGKALDGLKVLGTRFHIQTLARLYRVEEILIADTEIEPERLTEIAKICQESNLRARMFPSSVEDFITAGKQASLSRNLEFSDILPLERIHSDHTAVKEILTEKTVLINGSGGSVGLELCRKILLLGCRKLIVIEKYESYLNEIVFALQQSFSHTLVVPVLHDTSRTEILENVFKEHRPHIVIQAGMRKYLPFLAVDLGDVGRNNYQRTFQLAKTAAKFHSEFFVMISSFVAATGGNFVADSLLVAEASLGCFFSGTDTRLIIARLCDIAENRGGIISVIENQIANQGTVTLPPQGAEVSLVSKESATEFILNTIVKASKNLSDKNVFVCDAPGTPLPLIEITRNLANFYGLKLGTDIEVKYADQLNEPAVTLSPAASSSVPRNTLEMAGVKTDNDKNGDKQESLFRKFVLADNSELTHQDWKVKTQELIQLCGTDLFARKT